MVFSRLRLLVKSLWHHRITNVAIVLATAVGSAVLTGAMLMGDSMRGSLRSMTLGRLGEIDKAIVTTRFFPAGLANRLEKQLKIDSSHVIPVVMVKGSVIKADGTVVPDVNVIGTNASFWQLFPPTSPADAEKLAIATSINPPLASALGIADNAIVEGLIVEIEKSSPIPKDQLLGVRENTLRPIRLDAPQVLSPDQPAGKFSLATSQKLAKNVFLPMENLARALGEDGRANVLLTHRNATQSQSVEVLTTALKQVLTLDDYGLSLRPAPAFGYAQLESRRLLVEPGVIDAAAAAATMRQSTAQLLSSYILDTIELGSKQVPYSVVVGLDETPGFATRLPRTAGEPGPIAPSTLVINVWTAEQLGAKLGDTLRIAYRVVSPDGRLEEKSTELKLSGIVPLAGPALDQRFTPEYPGITDAKTIASWKSPFPYDEKRIRKADEEYWNEYRTTPKAYVSLATATQLWATRFGAISAIRFPIPMAADAAKPELDGLDLALRQALEPEAMGFSWQPIRQLDLEASNGSTEFNGLFIAFSFFLIIAAGLLVSLLFRLNAERRANEMGLLLATGWSLPATRRQLLGEGLLLSGFGSALGLVLAIGYAHFLLLGMSSWWQQAVNTPFLSFHAETMTFVSGYIFSVVISLIAIYASLRLMGKTRIVSLLSRGFTFAAVERVSRRGWTSLFWMIVGVGLALAGLAGGLSGGEGASGGFFASGAGILITGLALLQRRTGQRGGQLGLTTSWRGILALGLTNAGRYPGRSLLTAGLISFATFVIVAMGIMRQGETPVSTAKDGPFGGFPLVAESTIPIFASLLDSNARQSLDLTDEAQNLLDQTEVAAFLVRAGDDASCLNIYQPRNPRLLGASAAFIERGGFRFASMVPAATSLSSPWQLLQYAEATVDGEVIPAIGDQNALDWILKLKLGDTLSVPSEIGKPMRLKIVAGLRDSVFQSELVVADKHLQKYFPSLSGKQFFLFAPPADKSAEFVTQVQTDLARYGMRVEAAAERLRQFRAVENTYMATFQTLGGLGLLLGTIGLAAVLSRNVWERRQEIALLRAVGFRASQIVFLVLSETTGLLVAGLLIGSAAATVAVIPRLVLIDDWSGLGALGWLLLAVLATGLTSCILAARQAVTLPLVATLRSE